MKKLLFVMLVLVIDHSFGQVPSFYDMNECEFFTYLKELKANNYHNPIYDSLKANERKKFDLLRKLETYLVVFAGDSIAPMFLDTTKINRQKQIQSFMKRNSYYCSAYVKAYFDTIENKKLNENNARKAVQKGKYENIKFLLLGLTDLNKRKNSEVERILAEFEESFTLQYLFVQMKEFENELPNLVVEENQKFLNERMDKVGQKIYTYYENYTSKNNILKGFEAYHENDVFLFGTRMNQDREMTGAFKFSFHTDYFKWRWLGFGLRKPIQQKILTYQTISIGGNGYTPYIRYRNNISLLDSLNKFDRPFCSYIYLERSKNRTWLKGLVRHKGEFQVGRIGTNGYAVQAQLHEDVIVSSQHVYGWEKQIAKEGRLFLQVNHKWDFLIFSNTNKFASVLRPKFVTVDVPKKNYGGANLIGEVDVRGGTLMTSAGAGLRFSTLNFLQQSGHQMISSRHCSRNGFGWKVDFGVAYRYVIHNSTLEGLGLITKFKDDEYDIVKADDYVLAYNQINRHMWIVDWGVNLKWRKTTVFYRQLYHTIEYRSALPGVDYAKLQYMVDPQDQEYYYKTIANEQNNFLSLKRFGHQIYGYGTLGINWIIE